MKGVKAMSRRSVSLLVAAIALVPVSAIAATTLLAKNSPVDSHAQMHAELADAAAVEDQAMQALGMAEGSCAKISDPMMRLYPPSEIDKAAASLAGPGWAASNFVGTPDELAASEHQKVAAAGATTAWTIWTNSKGRPTGREYHRIDLPSGKVAWQPGKIVENAPCDEGIAE